MKKYKKIKAPKLLKKSQFSSRQLLLFAAVFAAVGGVIIYRSFASNPNLAGDLNNDNAVNALDLSILLSNYGTSNNTADINGDGIVSVLDLSILLSNYGRTYSPPSTSSLGVLRIINSQPIPSDLSHYRLLILDAARYSQVAGLKAQWPQLKIIGYKNLTFAIDYSTDAIGGNAGVPWGEAQSHPEWFLLDSAGNRVHSVSYPNAWFVDPASATYENAWYNDVISFLHSAPWDGVFMDDANADDGPHLNNNYSLLTRYPTRDAYRAAVRAMLVSAGPRIKTAGYLALPNIGASWDQPDVWADWAGLTSGVMREHFLKWGESTEPVFTGSDWTIHTNVERAVESANRMFIALTYGNSNDTTKQTYIRASFLLFWDPNTSSVAIWAPNDSPTFDTDLGPPTAAAVQNGSVWTRQFQHGSVTVDTAAGTASINTF